MIPAPDRNGGHDVHESTDQASDAERPRQRDVADCRPHSEGKYEPANARSGRADAVGQAATPAEPLGENGDAGDVGEAHSEAHEDSLGKVEVPDESCKRGRDEACGLERDAHEHRGVDAVSAGDDRHDWRHQHCHGEIKTADEGKVDVCGARVDLTLKIIRKEDTIRLLLISAHRAWFGCGVYSDNAPGEAVDGEAGGEANPAISAIRRSGEIVYGEFIRRALLVMAGFMCIIAHSRRILQNEGDCLE